MASILDLPDECLILICKNFESDAKQYWWSNVCKRFEHIFVRYFHDCLEVDDIMEEICIQIYGHLVRTDDFPLLVIKILDLSQQKCSKYFLNKLRDCHKEIEEAILCSFTDEYLAELMPLPNLKKLKCMGPFKGRSLIELDSLTELRIYSNTFFDPKYLLQITYFNPLRTLVMPSEPHMFSDRYAFEMIENLKNVEELEISFNPCKSWQLVGTLPKLKKLTIWCFASHECETCLENPNLYQTCVWQHAKFFFDELRLRNQLEELVFRNGNVSEQHFLRISELTNLKRLHFFRAAFKHFLTLDVFKDLVNLEELRLEDSTLENTEGSLELIRCCKKLKVLRIGPYELTKTVENPHPYLRIVPLFKTILNAPLIKFKPKKSSLKDKHLQIFIWYDANEI